ncbi:MAG: SHOCT domain-containing protein [Chloroflexi bacterium]|nr:SHOCT domain-containing protein [Chloroflexota bacterium]
MWHTNDGMGWWMVFMGVFWILFWASLIYVFVVAIVRPERSRPADEAGDALDIAKRRLARGEINTAEFQEIRQHIEGNVSRPQPS